jgi:hypothetical protein
MLGLVAGFVSALLVLVASGCSGPKLYDRPVLAQQLLRPHRDYPGELVNQRCVEWKNPIASSAGVAEAACAHWDLERHSLVDQVERDRLRGIKIECLIAGRRYDICPRSAPATALAPCA